MNAKKILSFALATLMVVSLLPMAVFADLVDYDQTISTSTDDYYNVISKQDYQIAPGIVESEIVLNNDDGSRRQVLFVMEADLNNEYVKVINSYNGMVPEYGNYKTGVMSEQAAYAEANGYGNVVGAMNTCLSWYTNYSEDRVGEPLGFIMLDAEILFDPGNCGYEYGNVGFPSVVVINKDFDENGNPRPDDIPKVEMPQIRSAADLDGWEEQVIPCSSGYILKDGVNQYSADHTSSSAPRSVVGIKPDGTVVIMLNDGRQAPYSEGMTMYELAEVMIGLGCSYAVNCDGGGSSTYLSQRPGEELKVNNSPSDGAERETTSGILFISTAPATGEFVRANITSENDYYTPNSVVEFSALGTDLVGTAADIPADAVWQLADSSFGTIEDGVFTSNGKEGVVTVQLVYNGEVVGQDTINIVMPDSIEFAQSNMVIPYGKTVEIVINATCDSKPVCIKASDVEFVLSNTALGTIDGFMFKAAEEGTVADPGTLTATIGELTITANVALGKGTEIAYDFEDQNLEGWSIWTNYPQYGPTGPNGSLKDDNGNYWYNGQNELGYISIVDETTGKVRNGNYALAVECDFSQPYETGFHSLNMKFPVVDCTDAVAVGFWIYVPYDARHADLTINSVLGEKFFADGSAFELYGGWNYITVDAPANGFYDISISVDERASGTDANGNNYYDYITEPNLNGKFTFYIDDISVDYSTAVEDRENPVFADVMVMDSVGSVNAVVNGQTINFNDPTFEVKVSDFDADNAMGLDASSAKAYIDGNAVECTFANGKISVNGLVLTDGVHTVKFEIADNAGNSAWVGGTLTVAAGTDASAITVVPQDPDADRLLIGSLYWMDVVASDIEKVQKVEMTFDLNNASYWELEGMTVAAGFTADWSVQADENIATITITRTGANALTGEAVIASFPVRTWESHITEYEGYENQTPATLVSRGIIWHQAIELILERGVVTYTDDTTSTFGMERVLVDTELFFCNYSRTKVAGAVDWLNAHKTAGIGFHEHTVTALDDVAETCTENGYTDRTYCEVCASVVEWGTTVNATGHNYNIISGTQLLCECGDAFSADGFVEINGGLMYFSGSNFYVGAQKIGTEYYNFDKNGLAYDGVVVIDGTECTFEDGLFVEDDVAYLAGICGENVQYIIYKDGRMVVTGSGAIMNYKSVGSVPWYQSHRYDIKTLYIGKDITVIGDRAFYNLWYLENVVFEEGSKLQEIRMVGLAMNSKMKNLVLPNGLKRIGDASFRELNAIETITIPSSVTYIASNAFYKTTGVTLNVASGSYAETFAKNNNFAYTVFEEPAYELENGTCGENATWSLDSKGVLTISGSGAMADFETKTAPWQAYKSNIKKIVVGKDITYVGKFAFMQCTKATEVVFEEGSVLETIGWGAFGYCSSLTEITIPASVKTLDKYAFYYSGLKTVEFAENSELGAINAYAFWNVASLESFFVPDKVLYIGENAFLGNKTTATFYVAEGTYSYDYFKSNNIVTREPIAYEIASGTCGENITWSLDSVGVLTLSGSGAMADFETRTAPWQEYKNMIKKVVIGKDITYVGKFAFMQCRNLSAVVFEEGSVLETIGWGAFGYCSSLTEITIPASVKTLDKYAFYYSGLKTVEFAENSELGAINAYAFWNVASLESFFVPDKVLYIGENAFLGNKTTATFYVAEGTYSYDYFKSNNIVTREPIAYEIASGTCGENITWSLDSVGVLTLSGSGAMADFETRTAPWQEYKNMIKKVVIGKDITYVGKFAFMQCRNLSAVVFEEGSVLETIGWGAFGYCSSLTEITIPASVKAISGYAFYYCTKLATVTFEEGSALETIGGYAFWNDSALTSANYPADTKLGENAFLGTKI